MRILPAGATAGSFPPLVTGFRTPGGNAKTEITDATKPRVLVDRRSLIGPWLPGGTFPCRAGSCREVSCAGSEVDAGAHQGPLQKNPVKLRLPRILITRRVRLYADPAGDVALVV